MMLKTVLATVALVSSTAVLAAPPPPPLVIGGLTLPRAAPLGLVEPNIVGGLVVTTLGALPELPGLGPLPSLIPRLDGLQILPLNTQPLTGLVDQLLLPLAPPAP